MLSFSRSFVALFLLSVLFAGCGGGGSSGGEDPQPASNNGAFAGKTFYSIGDAEIGVIDLHEGGSATVTRTVTALDHTEEIDAQWQASDTTLSIDFGNEHRQYRIEPDGSALVNGELHWQQIVTPTVELMSSDFWMAPMTHFYFNADGSGVVNFYMSGDEPVVVPLQWHVDDKSVVVQYAIFEERYYIVDNPTPGYLSAIVFRKSASSMSSYLAELTPYTPPQTVFAIRAQISERKFRGWYDAGQLLLDLHDDGSYRMTLFPNTYDAESFEETGSWQLGDNGALTLTSGSDQRQFVAKMKQSPILEAGIYRYQSYDVIEKADVTGILWSAGIFAYWFDADGTGFARSGTAESGYKIPFNWQQHQDHIRIDFSGMRYDWIVTALDRNLGTLGVLQMQLGDTTYRSLEPMQFSREQLLPATANMVNGRRFYRLDENKAELLRLGNGNWFETAAIDLETEATSDDYGTWNIDANGNISLAGQHVTRTLFAADAAGAAVLQDGPFTYHALQMNLAAADLIGQWQAPGGIGTLLFNGDGTGSIVNHSNSLTLDFNWQIVADHAHVQLTASPSMIYDWYLTAPAQEGQAPAMLQCTISGSGCSALEFLPFARQ